MQVSETSSSWRAAQDPQIESFFVRFASDRLQEAGSAPTALQLDVAAARERQAQALQELPCSFRRDAKFPPEVLQRADPP